MSNEQYYNLLNKASLTDQYNFKLHVCVSV